VCRECFYRVFEEEVHNTIVAAKLFAKGQKVAIAASGGKGGVFELPMCCQCRFGLTLCVFLVSRNPDSTVLAYVMKLLNDRHSYGLDLCLLSVDEGITGYRDDSLETVKRNEVQYALPLKIVSYEELYGWSMDAIVAKIGKRNNCGSDVCVLVFGRRKGS
jgi:cytoplasmic tRNA 2-thiolation protein 1